MKHLILSLIYILTAVNLFAVDDSLDSVSSQNLGLNEPDQLVWHETFDNSSLRWRTSNSADEVFFVQGGEYHLHRKTLSGPGLILPEDGDSYSESIMEMDVTLDPKTSGSAAGLVFLAAQDGSLAFVFEINDKKEYRIRKIEGGIFKGLSGKVRNDYWEGEKQIAKLGEMNVLKAMYLNNQLSFYINNKKVWEGEHYVPSRGKVGVLIGPGAKATIDEIKVYVSELEAESIKKERDKKDPLLAELTAVIATLRNTINAQNKELDSLRKANDKLEKEIAKYDNNPRNSKKLGERIAQLEKENKSLQNQVKALTKQVDDLKKFQENVKKREGGDLIIKLSAALSEEQNRNAELESENRTLNKRIQELEKELNKYQENE